MQTELTQRFVDSGLATMVVIGERRLIPQRRLYLLSG